MNNGHNSWDVLYIIHCYAPLIWITAILSSFSHCGYSLTRFISRSPSLQLLYENNLVIIITDYQSHYNDVTISAMASQITSLTIVCSVVNSGTDQRKYQSSAWLAFCKGNSPVTGEFPAQSASNAENISIWWRHHAIMSTLSWLWITRNHCLIQLWSHLQGGLYGSGQLWS